MFVMYTYHLLWPEYLPNCPGYDYRPILPILPHGCPTLIIITTRPALPVNCLLYDNSSSSVYKPLCRPLHDVDDSQISAKRPRPTLAELQCPLIPVNICGTEHCVVHSCPSSIPRLHNSIWCFKRRCVLATISFPTLDYSIWYVQ